MEALQIIGDSDVPEVVFSNDGNLFMGGSSLPENPKEFFSPIISWIEDYKRQFTTNTKIDFCFEYLNTASTNMMARIIESLQEIKILNGDLSITWYYASGDFDMKELGLELLEDSYCHYEIVEVETKD